MPEHDSLWYASIIHNILRWGVVLFGLWAVLNAVSGSSAKRAFTASDKRPGMFFMIFCDIQLLVGVFLYIKAKYYDAFNEAPFSELMKNSVSRFWLMEHEATMIIAWILVHIGYSSVKRADTDSKKFKKALIFYGIAFLLILLMIPWPFRELGIGRDWWPKM